MAINAHSVTAFLEVFDMPTSIAFYRDVLGCEIVQTSDAGEHFSWAMLKLGGATLMLNTAYDDDERPLAPDPGRVGGHADTELFFECPDVDDVYAHLRTKGCDVRQPEITHYGMKQVWAKDPDGFQICFQCPVGSRLVD
jgi:glyoxylase I family protein